MTGLSTSPADELEPVDVVGELELATEIIRELRLGYIERRDKINGEVGSYQLGDRSDRELESAGWQDEFERWDDVQEESDEDSSANLSAGKTERVGGLQTWRLVGCVFLPFASGYYLSYLFRTINTLIAGPLSREFHLDAANLGLLTSVYLLFFGGVQIPIGMLLDRFGPRRVQGVLLIVAAAGAALFGASGGFVTLLIARAMIGIGVAAALMAGLKAIVMWFPRERIALVNGYMVMMGALGALSATAPAEWLLKYAGWRGLFELLAVATLATAVLIVVAVPEKARAVVAGTAPVTLRMIYTDQRF